MTRAAAAPTKSNLLRLRRQLAFALEGYDLLEQKRQILALELVEQLKRIRAAERDVAAALAPAHGALREATLDSGSEALERAAAGAPADHRVELAERHLMGVRLPRIALLAAPPGVRFGFLGTSPNADLARLRFAEVLPRLAGLAELQNAVLRLGRELRRTQRRCNALTRIFIPDCSQAIRSITASLEERERESFVDRKLRNRT